MDEPKKSEEEQSSSSPQPSWIDEELIQQALRKGGEGNWQVESISVSRASAAGDNYGSTIYRVKVTLSNASERSFIIKSPALGSNMSSLTTDSGIFKRETLMLSEVIPQMQALLEEAAPGRFPPLAPRCFHHGTSPVEFIVLEDLTPSGFKMAERRRGLGLRHSLIALRTVARFHAASCALLKRQPGLPEKLGNTWRTMFDQMQVFFSVMFKAAADACRTWDGFEEYADQLDKFKLVAMETLAHLNDAKPGAFNVIAHGDFWVNNMMFSYDEKFAKNHRAIDLQISHFASPAVDLVHFLASSVSENVHEHHQDLLIREYHYELKETKELLGLEAPSLRSLLSAIDIHGPLSLYVTMAIPITRAEHGVDIDAIFSGDHSSLVPLYDLLHVKKWMQRVLPDYARRGWLPA